MCLVDDFIYWSFWHCSELKDLNIKYNNAKVIIYINLISLDVSSFVTRKCTSFDLIFNEYRGLLFYIDSFKNFALIAGLPVKVNE